MRTAFPTKPAANTVQCLFKNAWLEEEILVPPGKGVVVGVAST